MPNRGISSVALPILRRDAASDLGRSYGPIERRLRLPRAKGFNDQPGRSFP